MIFPRSTSSRFEEQVLPDHSRFSGERDITHLSNAATYPRSLATCLQIKFITLTTCLAFANTVVSAATHSLRINAGLNYSSKMLQDQHCNRRPNFLPFPPLAA